MCVLAPLYISRSASGKCLATGEWKARTLASPATPPSRPLWRGIDFLLGRRPNPRERLLRFARPRSKETNNKSHLLPRLCMLERERKPPVHVHMCTLLAHTHTHAPLLRAAPALFFLTLPLEVLCRAARAWDLRKKRYIQKMSLRLHCQRLATSLVSWEAHIQEALGYIPDSFQSNVRSFLLQYFNAIKTEVSDELAAIDEALLVCSRRQSQEPPTAT